MLTALLRDSLLATLSRKPRGLALSWAPRDKAAAYTCGAMQDRNKTAGTFVGHCQSIVKPGGELAVSSDTFWFAMLIPRALMVDDENRLG